MDGQIQICPSILFKTNFKVKNFPTVIAVESAGILYILSFTWTCWEQIPRRGRTGGGRDLFLIKNWKDMDKQEFLETLNNVVANCIEEYAQLGPDAQLSINPVTKYITVDTGDDIQYDIADADETVEMGAGAERPDQEDADDYQARQNPDFYPLIELIKRDDKGHLVPDQEAIDSVIAAYFTERPIS